MTHNGFRRSEEWRAFESDALATRRRLMRTLRRELVHDPRAGALAPTSLSPIDLVDEAFAWALENWKAKPMAIPPEQWMRKRALQLLDEALDQVALDAEGRAEERDEESRLLAHDVLRDDTERARWFDIAGLAGRTRKRKLDGVEDEPFDGLHSDPEVSSPDGRFDARETLVELERALLKLPERRRKAVAHRYLDGLPVREIAYLLDEPVEIVEKEIDAALRDLHSEFAARA